MFLVVKESTGSPDRGFGSSGTTCLYHALSERDMPVCFELMFVLLEVSLVAYTAFGLVWLQSSLWNQVFDADVVKESTGSPDRGFGSSGTTCLYHALSERDMPVCFELMFVLLEVMKSTGERCKTRGWISQSTTWSDA
ncbi:hypothetical protein BC941DRAFT_509767 [Chlamydoabsidia padenii]|nr:hypothetical protein BC941DRAFT_509767 [Chlamydoabsidia padenii]